MSPLFPAAIPKLNKEQDIFIKKIESIKLLQEDLKRLSAAIPPAIASYEACVANCKIGLEQLHVEKVKGMDSFFTLTKYTKKEREVIASYMLGELTHFLDSDDTDLDLLEAFQRYAQESYDAFKRNRDIQFKAMSEQMLKNIMGADVDIDPEETIEERAQRIRAKLDEQAEKRNNAKKKKPKSKAEVKLEDVAKAQEELKSKSIRSIYIDLIKAYHPDKEPNAEKKLEKEEISKKITEAYNNNDLYNLLQLEIQYLERKESHIENLAPSKLKLYIEVLDKQISELDMELYQLKNRNREVYQNMCTQKADPKKYLSKVKARFEEEKSRIKRQISIMKNNNNKAMQSIIIEYVYHEIEKRQDV